MFDNLRESESERQAFQDALGVVTTPSDADEAPRMPVSRGLFGMSAVQRLVVALLLLFAVGVIGTMCLLVTGRISAF